MVMQNEFTILGFFFIFVVLINLLSIPYGESFIRNADFLDEDTKLDYSSNPFNILGFMLSVEAPETSKLNNALGIYRLIYSLVISPFIFMCAYIFVRLLRGI